MRKQHHHSSSAEQSKCKNRRCIASSKELSSYLASRPNLKKMRNAFDAWVESHGFSPYLKWHTPDQWLDVDCDEYHGDSELVLCMEESELCEILGLEYQAWAVNELMRLAGQYGYYWELGHIYDMAFYKNDC